MSENEPSNSNNQVEANDENVNFIKDIYGPSPFVSEISHIQGERIIKITAWRGIYYSFIIFFILEIIEIIIALTVFKNAPILKWIFIFLLLPIFIHFLFIPVKAICKYDYNNKTFSSHMCPVIPIPYPCYSFSISFNDIDFFYLFKIKKAGKKYYKIGVNTKDGEDHDIILGQDDKCSLEFDDKILNIPSIMKLYLRE